MFEHKESAETVLLNIVQITYRISYINQLMVVSAMVKLFCGLGFTWLSMVSLRVLGIGLLYRCFTWLSMVSLRVLGIGVLYRCFTILLSILL
jgi:hypothetical protein